MARMMKVPDGTLRILVQGAQRVRIEGYVSTDPYLVARIQAEPDVVEESTELQGLARNVQSTFATIIEEVPYLPEELQLAVANLDDPAELAHMIAGALRIKTEEKQELLEERDVARRLEEALGAARPRARADLDRLPDPVAGPVRDGEGPARVLPAPAAQGDPGGARRGRRAAGRGRGARERIEAANLPEHARSQADRELRRFERLPPQSAEHGVIRTYLEWIVDLPWSVSTDDDLDLKKARRVLDRDHYDIDKVKERILEFLAVQKLNPDAGSSILCFVGPPGVGKTSLGEVDRGRDGAQVRADVRDESEIRGHRRTYIGAMPGTIIRALRDAESNNPVLMIDEIDKMGADFRGDPSSAMLEVLDPEQNSNFRDHYLDLPFDLSRVMFITTANQLEPIPPALRDRMERSSSPATRRRRSSRSRSATSSRGRSSETASIPRRSSSPRRPSEEIAEGYTREARRAQPRAGDRRGVPEDRASPGAGAARGGA